MAADDPSPAEQVAFLRGVAFAYRRATSMLENGLGELVTGEQLDEVHEQLTDAARAADAACAEAEVT